MLGTGNELGVDAGSALSLTGGLSPALPGRMRHHGGEGDLGGRRRQKKLGQWLRRTGLPVYLVGSVPHGGQLCE